MKRHRIVKAMLSAHFCTLVYSLEGWAWTLLATSIHWLMLNILLLGALIPLVSALIPVKMQIPLGGSTNKVLSALSSPEQERAQQAEPG